MESQKTITYCGTVRSEYILVQKRESVTGIPSRQDLGAWFVAILPKRTKYSVQRRDPFRLVDHEMSHCPNRVFKEKFSEDGNLYC